MQNSEYLMKRVRNSKCVIITLLLFYSIIGEAQDWTPSVSADLWWKNQSNILTIGSNYFVIPEHVWGIALSKNSPKQIEMLPQLKRSLEFLHVTGNVSNIVQRLNHLSVVCPNIHYLKVTFYDNDKLDSSFGAAICKFKGLRFLQMFKCNGALPLQLYECRNLEEITLVDCKDISISDGIDKLPKLKRLFLEMCDNVKVSSDLRKCSSLIYIYIIHCGLRGSIDAFLPVGVQELCVPKNNLIFPDMSGYQDLRIINADNNQLSEVPKGLLNLPKLESVGLSFNKFRALNIKEKPSPSLKRIEILGNPGLKLNDLAKRLVKEHIIILE